MKISALFVDDEPLVLSGLRRGLRSLHREWDLSFAGSGEEALALMERNSFSVVVSDMRMPEMDGAALLDQVAACHPSVARLVLSGHADLEAILRAVRPAHQFFAKPCEPKHLGHALERIRDFVTKEQQGALCLKIGAHRRLPSPRVRIEELRTALAESTIDMTKVGEIVSRDIAMSVQILRLVNSAFFGPPVRAIADPIEAVSVLGDNITLKLLENVQLFRPVEDFVTDGERAVTDLNDAVERLERAIELDGVRTLIPPRTFANLLLAGRLAAIEARPPLDLEGERLLGKMLLSFWGLDVYFDSWSSTSMHAMDLVLRSV